MPAIIDHEQRRQKVAEIASELIGQGGAEALTVRNVAKAAGCSTAIVSHFFASKRELLLVTYRSAVARTTARVDEAGMAGADLQSLLEILLPLDAASRRDWRVLFCFWGAAMSDAEFAAEQGQESRIARDWVEKAIIAEMGRKMTEDEVERLGRRLITLAVGIAMQAIFDPEQWDATRQRGVLADELDSVQVPKGKKVRFAKLAGSARPGRVAAVSKLAS